MLARIHVACIALLAFCAQPNHAAVQGGLGYCSGTAEIGECDDPDETHLDCMGQCPVEMTCQVQQFQSGSTTYFSCACIGGGEGGGGGEGPCCHLIVIVMSGGAKTWGARGNCPSCGSQGSCQLDTSGCQAICS